MLQYPAKNPLTDPQRCAILPQSKEMGANGRKTGYARFRRENIQEGTFLLLVRSTLTIEMWKAELELVWTGAWAVQYPWQRGSGMSAWPVTGVTHTIITFLSIHMGRMATSVHIIICEYKP
jgi:hypothetical protein